MLTLWISRFLTIFVLVCTLSPSLSAQCTIKQMFSNADLVVQGKIVSDTAYEANGWVYTSYIIEQCAIQKDGNGSRGKTLAITKMGGLLNNVDYYSPHGVDISGGEEAVFS